MAADLGKEGTRTKMPKRDRTLLFPFLPSLTQTSWITRSAGQTRTQEADKDALQRSGAHGAAQLTISHFELPLSLSAQGSKAPRCFPRSRAEPGRQNTPRQEEKADELLIAIKL